MIATLDLTAAQQATVERHGGCDLERFENPQGTLARQLAYAPLASRTQPFQVVAYVEFEPRRKPGVLHRQKTHWFADYDEALAFAQAAETASYEAPFAQRYAL